MTQQADTEPVQIGAMSPGEVLAHALELTHDSADRYTQLQHCLEAHHNQAAAQTLQQIVTISLATAEAMMRDGAQEPLPRIAPWQLCWRCADLIPLPQLEAAEAQCGHQISIAEVLRLAVAREDCALVCYQNAQKQVGSSASRAMLRAVEMRQTELIARLQALLDAARADADAVPTDLDPPNRPE
jgi:hypothetical protein